jgi:hypothetical protein
MAWSTPLTAVANATLTAAQWNASVRDDLNETAPAKATAAGQLWVSTAANAGAMRTPAFAHTTASDTTGSIGTYVDLAGGAATAVTVTSGVAVITGHGASMSNGTGGGNSNMSFAITGATTLAADDSKTIRYISPNNNDSCRMCAVHFTPGLTAGSNTFTPKYKTTTGGTATFGQRHMLVIPL